MENGYGLLIEWGARISVGLVTAAFASWITVRFALKRFISEKWWEKKAEAYDAILESLHYMKRTFGKDLDNFQKEREVAADRDKEGERKYREAYDELKKRIDIGQFVLSDNAVTVLSVFQKDYRKAGDDHPHDLFTYLDDSLGALDRALKQMRVIAKADLKGQ